MDNRIDFYRKMYLIRRAEDVIIDNYYDDDMKTPMHMSRGAEAIAVGVCSALGDRGQYFTTYRSHAVYLASGGDLKKFFAEMYGKKEGRYAGKSGSMHIASPETGHISSSAIVASHIPVALGMAFANKRKGNNKIVTVFFGDGAVDEGGFWESINMASLWDLPILFVCEDNRLAVHTSCHERHAYEEILPIVAGFDMSTSFEYGLDVCDVYDVTLTNKNCMDAFNQAAFIQLEYFRFLEHVGVNSDTNEKYRILDGWEDCPDHDPVKRLRDKMVADNIDVSEIEKIIDAEVDDALEYAKSGSFSDVSETYKDVFYG